MSESLGDTKSTLSLINFCSIPHLDRSLSSSQSAVRAPFPNWLSQKVLWYSLVVELDNEKSVGSVTVARELPRRDRATVQAMANFMLLEWLWVAKGMKRVWCILKTLRQLPTAASWAR